MDRHTHWERIYQTKGERDVSWFQESPAISLQLIRSAGLRLDMCVLDVGGGDSRLVDALLQEGVGCVCVLDVSGSSLTRAQARLGTESHRAGWIVADVIGAWAARPVDIWHDRAVFHFLTNSFEREKYVTQLRRHLKPGGSAIIATFNLDGPDTCSGLSVARYSPKLLKDTLGPKFRLVEAIIDHHRTPSGTIQSFQYSRFIYADPS